MKKTVAALLCAMLSFSSIPKISAFDAAQIDYDDIILTLLCYVPAIDEMYYDFLE